MFVLLLLHNPYVLFLLRAMILNVIAHEIFARIYYFVCDNKVVL